MKVNNFKESLGLIAMANNLCVASLCVVNLALVVDFVSLACLSNLEVFSTHFLVLACELEISY